MLRQGSTVKRNERVLHYSCTDCNVVSYAMSSLFKLQPSPMKEIRSS